MQRIEYKLDGGTPHDHAAACRSPPRATTSSRRASSTSPATPPTGARTSIGIDKTVPTLAVDCGTTAWRNSAGQLLGQPPSGGALRPADADRRGRLRRRRRRSPTAASPSAPRAPPRSTSAPSTAPATRRSTTRRRQDRHAPRRPRPSSCAAVAGTSWVCTASGGDALSGLAVAGLVGRRLRSGRDRHRRHVRRSPRARVVVYADRRRRQHGRVGPGRARRPHAAARRPREEPTPRTTSEAVLMRKGGAVLRAPARPARRSPRCRPARPSTCARSRSARARSGS